MSVLNLARPELLQLKPYSSARMEAGTDGLLLNANEAPQSFAGAGFAADLNRYPQPQPQELLQVLARTYAVDPGQVWVGRGSDEAIDLLVRAFCRAGLDQILICPPTFGMYRVCAAVQGAGVLEQPLDPGADFALDFAAVERLTLANPVKLVFLCSPNNPTGGLLPRAPILALAETLRERALVVVDEAYVEFSDQASLARDLETHPNLAVLRTLSKAYGLAGARIGCLLAAPGIIGLVRRIMAPYPLPQPCVAAALAALAARPDVDRWLQLCRSERERVSAALSAARGVVQVWPSQANFLSFRVLDAQRCLKGLAAAGVVVRDVSHYLGLQDCLRVSLGTPAQNDRFLRALEQCA